MRNVECRISRRGSAIFPFCLFILLSSIFVLNSFSSSAQNPDSAFVHQDTTAKIIGDIVIVGNKITKDGIITRELTFKKGDTISFSDFEHQKTRSEQNVFNTSLFN